MVARAQLARNVALEERQHVIEAALGHQQWCVQIRDVRALAGRACDERGLEPDDRAIAARAAQLGCGAQQRGPARSAAGDDGERAPDRRCVRRGREAIACADVVGERDPGARDHENAFRRAESRAPS